MRLYRELAATKQHALMREMAKKLASAKTIEEFDAILDEYDKEERDVGEAQTGVSEKVRD